MRPGAFQGIIFSELQVKKAQEGARHQVQEQIQANSIETPQGGPPPPPPLVAGMLEDCHAVGEGRKGGGKALKAGNLRKKSFSGACWPGGSKIEAWSLQNRGPEPPKSRPRPSKIEPGALQDATFEDI